VPRWKYGTPDSKSLSQKPTKRRRFSDSCKSKIEPEDGLFQNGIQRSFFGIDVLEIFPARTMGDA
jgi:hypothetical protein